VPVTVVAAEGTAIKTAADFEAIANDPTGSYYLANDIVFNGKVYDTGFILADFSGVLDGNGYSLLNFTITNGEVNTCTGIMDYLGNTAQKTVEIKNLNIGSAANPVKLIVNDVARKKHHGIIAGRQADTVEAIIENVNIYAYADIDAEMNGQINLGGYIGYSRFITLKNCTMNVPSTWVSPTSPIPFIRTLPALSPVSTMILPH